MTTSPRPLSLLLATSLAAAPAFAQDSYRTPPDILVRCVDAPPLPGVSVGPQGKNLLIIERESTPRIDVLARPILRLAGTRFDPQTNGRQRGARTTGIELLSVADGARHRVALPDDADIGSLSFSHDGTQLAFTNTTDQGIELWVCDVASASARRLSGVHLNAVLGSPFRWMPDQRSLLCFVTDDHAHSDENAMRSGPVVQEASGSTAPVRTYQDLLTNAEDAAEFEHHATTEMVLIDIETGGVVGLGEKAMYRSATPSPDGQHILVTTVEKPFSYLVPVWSFARRISVYDRSGEEVLRVADLPVSDKTPIGGVAEGPRSVRWMVGADATLCWVEARDGGDPRNEVPHRDEVMVQAIGETEARSWLRVENRFSGLTFAPEGTFALATEMDRDTREIRHWQIGQPGTDVAPKLLEQRSMQDAYSDPGSPLTTTDARGQRVLRMVNGALLRSGSGATPTGDRPFLDLSPLGEGDAVRMFHSSENAYERVAGILTDDASQVLVSHETPSSPPSFHVLNVASGERRPLLELTDPLAELTANIGRKLINYARNDGVALSGTLYTPPGWDGETKLPLLVWAYPREFNRAADAGQVRGSQKRYRRPSGDVTAAADAGRLRRPRQRLNADCRSSRGR